MRSFNLFAYFNDKLFLWLHFYPFSVLFSLLYLLRLVHTLTIWPIEVFRFSFKDTKLWTFILRVKKEGIMERESAFCFTRIWSHLYEIFEYFRRKLSLILKEKKNINSSSKIFLRSCSHISMISFCRDKTSTLSPFCFLYYNKIHIYIFAGWHFDDMARSKYFVFHSRIKSFLIL